MKPIPDPPPEKAGLPEFFDARPGFGEPLGEALRSVGVYRAGEALGVIARDGYVHRSMFGGLMFCFLLSAVNFPPGDAVWSGVSWILLVAWVLTGFAQAGMWQDLSRASQLMEGHPALSEHLLSGLWGKKVAPAAIRANVYYRLALLRFRQGRYAEAAMIGDDLIELDHSALRQHRANLLLMRTEAALKMNDLGGAHRGLEVLYPMKLSLLEGLQRLLLRTVYESKVSRWDHVMYGWKEKVAWSDLMPVSQCRMMHGMLETGAEKAGMTDLAHWLKARGELLGEGGERSKV